MERKDFWDKLFKSFYFLGGLVRFHEKLKVLSNLEMNLYVNLITSPDVSK